jgi:hypothetical protein
VQPDRIAIGQRIAWQRDMRIALHSCALACALAGCAYKPGSFASSKSEFTGQRASVGCLDIAVDRKGDLEIGPVLAFQFANRCDRVTTIDLGAAVVIGRSAEGDVPLLPYDPAGEIKPVALDGRTIGGETLAYPANRALPQVCIDVATLAQAGASQWLCIGADPTAVAGKEP